MILKHNAEILVGDYFKSDQLNEEVLRCLKTTRGINTTNSNVKASLHTDWNWELYNPIFKDLKVFLMRETNNNFSPGKMCIGHKDLICKTFWANVYEKGDYANTHCHKPSAYSFAYFVKSKWYDSPLIFTDSGKRIRPKEGRYIIFPSYLKHRVPKNRFDCTRITLSGNFDLI